MNSTSNTTDLVIKSETAAHKTSSASTWIILVAVAAALFWALRAPSDHVTRVSLMSFVPDAGYMWVNKDSPRMGVKWTPGIGHPDPKFAHIQSAGNEGRWVAEAGYRFSDAGKLSAAVWAPTTKHPRAAHVIAANKEGSWEPEAGYTFANLVKGDLSVVRVDQPGANTNGSDRTGRIVGNFLTGLVCHQLSQPDADDGFFKSFFVRPMARNCRDEATTQMGQALFGK